MSGSLASIELISVQDVAELRVALHRRTTTTNGGGFVTRDLSTLDEAKRLGVKCYSEWDYLLADEVEANRNLAMQSAKEWAEAYASDFVVEGVSLPRCAWNEFLLPFEIALNAASIYRKLLSSFDVSHLQLIERTPIGIVRTSPVPLHAAATAVADAAIRWTAESLGITVRLTSPPKFRSNRKRKKNWLAKRSPWVRQSPRKNKGSEILVFDDGLRPHEKIFLETALAELNVGFLRVSSLSRLPISAPNPRIIDEAWSKSFDRFRQNQDSYSGCAPVLFANRHFLFQFEAVWNEMRRTSNVAATIAAVLDNMRPSIIILGHAAFTYERFQVAQARLRDICTISLLHGSVGHRMSFSDPGDTDLLFAVGPNHESLLNENGVDGGRIQVIGSVQHERAYNKAITKVQTAKSTNKITILTANPNLDLKSVANLTGHAEAWSALLKIIDSHPEWQFEIKPHPTYDHFDFYRRVSARRSNLTLREDVELCESLRGARIGLMVNYCTTAALDAILKGVPVLLLDNAIYDIPSCRPSIPNAIATVHDCANLEDTLYRFMRDDQACATAINVAVQALQYYFGDIAIPVDRKVRDALQRQLDLVGAKSHPQGFACEIEGENTFREFLQTHATSSDSLEHIAILIGMWAPDCISLRRRVFSLLARYQEVQHLSARERKRIWLLVIRAALARWDHRTKSPNPVLLFGMTLLNSPFSIDPFQLKQCALPALKHLHQVVGSSLSMIGPRRQNTKETF